MTILIIEDELPAQRMLKDMLAELGGDLQVVGCLGSVASAIRWFRENKHPDIVLLDIQLSDGISFNILKQVDVESMLIFTTAFDEYAVQAFKVNSLDYILKPFEVADLRRALEKYASYSRMFLRERNSAVDFETIVSAISNARPEYRSRFLIRSAESFWQLPVEEIAYIFSANKITWAVLFDARQVQLDFPLEKLVEQLNPERFFKINRQYILSIEAIQKIHTYFDGKLVVDTRPKHKEPIIVGKDKAAEFKRWIDR